LKRKDKFSIRKRSEIMSRIRSKNTRLDIAMKKILRGAGVSFRAYPRMFGNPDFLIDNRIVVFCDSSFWHGRNWKKLKAQLQKGSNASYWVRHIERNIKRDRVVTRTLRASGYKVVRIWDNDILRRPTTCLRKLGLLKYLNA